MPFFQFTARTSSGEKITGEYEGATPQTVADYLLRQGHIPINIDEKKKQVSLGDLLQNKKQTNDRLSKEDIIMLSRQLYTLFKAGVPLMQALDGLQKSSENPNLKSVVGKLRESLDQGIDFTAALSRQPKIFSPLFISLVRIGETTGNMAEIFLELSTYLSKDRETQQRVKSALRYPMTVIVVIVIALTIMNIFVIPKFAAIYGAMNAELPLPTQIIMGFSKIMVNYGWLIFLIGGLGTFLFIRYIKTKSGQFWWHKTIIKIPLFGKLIKMAAVTRFSRMLAITIKSGVPIEQSLRVVSHAIGNVFIEERVEKVRVGVERGESISYSIEKIKLFPPIVVQMISIGEQSGSLDNLIKEVADYYEREIDHTISGLSAAIEPILIFIIAGMVLIMALGIFLPMWNMLDAMR